jgi:hypothetical protein
LPQWKRKKLRGRSNVLGGPEGLPEGGELKVSMVG